MLLPGPSSFKSTLKSKAKNTNEKPPCIRRVQHKCLCVSSLSRTGARRIERAAAFCEVFVYPFHHIELQHSFIRGTYFYKTNIVILIMIITDEYLTRTRYQGFVSASSDSQVDSQLPLSKRQNFGQRQISQTA